MLKSGHIDTPTPSQSVVGAPFEVKSYLEILSLFRRFREVEKIVQ